MCEFSESSIDLAVRFWHAPDIQTMWRVRSAVAMAAKRARDQNGISIPFPQRVLHFAETGRPERREGDDERDEQATSSMY